MIRRFGSDLASFKTLTFRPGLNVLLAEKSEGASDRQSRNGAGKTSFIELVHFLFGADARKNSIFRSEALSKWIFDVSVDIRGEMVTAARSGSKPNRILLNGPVEPWPIPPQLVHHSGLLELSNENWKANLGHLWFGLPISEGGETDRFRPSFRSLFSYFARRQLSGGFQHPMQHSARQQTWDQLVKSPRSGAFSSTSDARSCWRRSPSRTFSTLRASISRVISLASRSSALYSGTTSKDSS